MTLGLEGLPGGIAQFRALPTNAVDTRSPFEPLNLPWIPHPKRFQIYRIFLQYAAVLERPGIDFGIADLVRIKMKGCDVGHSTPEGEGPVDPETEELRDTSQDPYDPSIRR